MFDSQRVLASERVPHVIQRTKPRFVFLVLVASIFACATAGAQPTLSGMVRNASTSGGVASADLDVFGEDGKSVSVTGARTASDGSFTITLPGPGSYLVRVDMTTSDPLADQYYPGVLLKSQASAIMVPSNSSAITGIDFNLEAGTTISGRVTGGGVGLSTIDLDLFAANGEFLGGYPATTDASGFFTIGGIPAGDYLLRADPDPDSGQYFVRTFYDAGASKETAKPITVSGTPVSGINWELPAGGVIRGTITSRSPSAPLAEIDLDLYTTSGDRVSAPAKSGLDGAFAIGPLPAGDYIVRTDPTIAQGWLTQYYGGGFDFSTGLPVSVATSADTSGIDFQLDPGGSISGQIVGSDGVTPLLEVDLDIFATDGSRVDATAKTDSNGNYQLGPLPAGSYLLKADPTVDSGSLGIYYGGDYRIATAASIAVLAGSDSPSKNFTLPAGGWVTGRILDTASQPISGIDLDPFLSSGERLGATARSAIDGSYMIGPFPVGSIVLRADPDPTAGYLSRYFPSAPDRVSAASVAISDGVPTTGVDITLDTAGWLSGAVTDLGAVPLEGIDIDLYDATTLARVRLGATTNAQGEYLIGPLPVGSYKVRADPHSGQSYARRYYNSAADLASSTTVSVLQGAGAINIDMSLEPGRSLSGMLTGPSGQPATGVDLDIIDLASGLRIEQTGLSMADGSFTLPPIPYGDYLLKADVNSLYALLSDTYFGNTSDSTLATTIKVDASAQLSAIDIQLQRSIVNSLSPVANGSGGYLVSMAGSPTEVTFDLPSSSSPVSSVSFEAPGLAIPTDTTAPYGFSTAGIAVGQYTIIPTASTEGGETIVGAAQTLYVLESNPSFADPLAILDTKSTDKLVIVWRSEAGKAYAAEKTDTLQGLSWVEEARYLGNGELIWHASSVTSTAKLFLRAKERN